MKRISAVINAMCTIIVSTNLFAVVSTPIQRIDVVNILSTGQGSSSQTAVVVAFENAGVLPCSNMTLPFQGMATIWVGVGQACVTPITGITITPVAGSSGVGTVYDTTPINYAINSSLYSTQISIIQSTAPVFDGSSGAVIVAGTAQATLVSHVANS